MSAIRLWPNTLFGRNRNEPEIWYGYVSADGGTLSAETAVALTEVDATPGLVYTSATKKITLPAYGVYRITARVSQTGASSYFEIYNLTGTAQLAKSLVAAGEKQVTHVVRTGSTAMDIQIRLDDQTTNTTTQAAGQVVVERVGRVFA